MKSSCTLAFAASIALAGAQGLTYNATTGTYTCAVPNAAYCASDSLAGNIIIRCNGLVGAPGNCNDNLAGEFPYGVSFAPCFQTSVDSGDAACTKNCIIYGGSGNYKGSSTVIADCIPQETPASSTSSTSSASKTSSTTTPTTTSTASTHFITPVTYTPPISASSLPPTFITLTTAPPSGSPSPSPIRNGTTITNNGTGSATHTPVPPTTAISPSGTGQPVIFKGAAASSHNDNKKACAGLAAFVAIFFVGFL